MKQLGSVEVSTVNTVMKVSTNRTVNPEETSPTNQSDKLNRRGDFGDVSLVELEVTKTNNKASNVISLEITSPGVGFSLANHSVVYRVLNNVQLNLLTYWPGRKQLK
ncbi:hypothetical protein Ddye_003926 [Dipteronia dyeriana]|uniref:Uncharacterized protein n=1 Tax=Dipteronia dyeriana TaxID=168575 RepID=A0AAE0CVS1_9ROSI|nr:hypothetical protein Ddye_003926 [Dipteronia dyeriana]